MLKISTLHIFGALILLILSIIFFLLSLFVLVYYIRRRYKLYKEINRIPQELLIKESYRNHLKNLKIKCIINNFIIVILVMEFILNFGHIFLYLPYLIILFVKDHGLNFLNLFSIENDSPLFTLPIYYSLVPVLSMLMDFLWLAYRKYEYKYTIIRWTWYIVIRIVLEFLLQYYSILLFFIHLDYIIVYIVSNSFYVIFPIIDFVQFVYYARRFYLHLKSREKEIQLFYFDKKAYLDSKYLRIHFKIATILVGIALFFSTLANTASLFTLFFDIPSFFIPIPQQLNNIIIIINSIFNDFIANFLFFISKVLFIFNYLYIFIAVVYKSYRDGQKLKNINDYIKPILKRYHDNYYNRYTNYA